MSKKKSELERRRAEILEDEAEIQRLQIKILENRAYIKGAEDHMPVQAEPAKGYRSPQLRPGSDMDKARLAILRAQKPLHITKILQLIGKEDVRQNRTSLASSLNAYANKSHIFTKADRNTFGLIDMMIDGQIELAPEQSDLLEDIPQ